MNVFNKFLNIQFGIFRNFILNGIVLFHLHKFPTYIIVYLVFCKKYSFTKDAFSFPLHDSAVE